MILIPAEQRCGVRDALTRQANANETFSMRHEDLEAKLSRSKGTGILIGKWQIKNLGGQQVLKLGLLALSRFGREDMIVISLGISTVIACICQTEARCRAEGRLAPLRRTRLLLRAVLATRRKRFGHTASDELTDDAIEALFIADGPRDRAQYCHEGQGTLHEQLLRGAEAMGRSCGRRSGRGQSS